MTYSIKIEEVKINMIKTQSKPKFIRDIQMFLGYINLYQRFNKNFMRITILFTIILQIISKLFLSTQANNNKKN